MKIIRVKIGERIIKVKDCRGLVSARGLMFDSLDDYDGALIYANAIWMPFVRYELDLLFLDEELKILEIQHAVPLTLHPSTWRVYKNADARYCLEIKSGSIRNLKGLIGKKVKLR